MTARGPYKSRHAAGTFGDLILAFYQSPRYRDWSRNTLKKYDPMLRDLMAANAKRMVADLTRGDVIRGRDELADTPDEANNWLKLMHVLLDYAVDLELVERNVSRDNVGRLRPKAPGGFRTWQEHEIAAFIDFHEPGTIPHRVLTLALCTGASRVDLVRLGWHSIRGDRIRYQRQKTRRDEEVVWIDLPILPSLAALLPTIPRHRMTFLETEQGRQRSDTSLTNDMGRWCLQAGLGAPDENGRGLNMHGLRKAVGRRLAEAGCSPYEVASVLGHRDIKSSQVYTKAFDRARGSTSAFEKVAETKPSNVTRLRRKE
jgi:integrase